MASLKAAYERRVCEGGAAAARPIEIRIVRAHLAAAPAAGAAPAATRTAVPAQATQDTPRVVLCERTEGHAAAAPAHSAEEFEAAPLLSPSARAHHRRSSCTCRAGALC